MADDRITHKVGTDGVLLGAWVKLRHDEEFILDIGTGSGLIALMMAQRTAAPTRIDAVEIEAEDARQAAENVAQSPWADRIRIHHTPVQKFDAGNRYDLIITNPPYFVRSLEPPDVKRGRARHTRELTFDDLLKSTARLMRDHGRLALILPHTEGLNFIALAEQYNLFPLRKTTFRTRAEKLPQRILLEMARDGEREYENEIQLYKEGEIWSDEYTALTKEFYLGGPGQVLKGSEDMSPFNHKYIL